MVVANAVDLDVHRVEGRLGINEVLHGLNVVRVIDTSDPNLTNAAYVSVRSFDIYSQKAKGPCGNLNGLSGLTDQCVCDFDRGL